VQSFGAQSFGAQSFAAQSFAAQSVGAQSFVALGDSFTEGVGDPRPDSSVGRGSVDQGWADRGWADRMAERLALFSPGLRYANLAVRGKLLQQVIDEQVPAAVGMRPDLVSIAAGGNDLLRPRTDPDALAQPFNDAVERLAGAGSRVLLFTGFDPGTFPLIRIIRGRAAVFNAHLRLIARRHDCLLVDLWPMKVLSDPRMWADDRLHLGPEGHRRVALRVCEVLGVPVEEDWREPLPAGPRPASAYRAAFAARRQDVQWARVHAAPWVRRRLRGASSGDNMSAKRPDLLPL
jgi:lysophospholipase L1-like esterase